MPSHPVGETMVHIPSRAITRWDVDYPQRFCVGYDDPFRVSRGLREYTISTTELSWEDMSYSIYDNAVSVVSTPQLQLAKGSQVKRRIYLISAADGSIRAIALGFRTDDAAAIEAWADSGDAALTMEIDPSEVDVKWLAPPVQATT